MTKNEKAWPRFRPGIAWIGFLLVVASYCLGEKNDDMELRRTLSQMDAAGQTLKSFKAKFSQKKYTAILDEFDTPDTGEFYYVRTKKGEVMVRQEVTSPGTKILTVKGKTAIFYQPKIKQAQIAALVGKYENISEYLTIGLGKSPATLKKFSTSYRGSESINGESCSVLLLKPASASRFSSVTLWVKKSNGILTQIKFLEQPSGDYTLLTYSDEKLNEPIPDSLFEQKLPKDVEKQYF
jgi:outer membrane lipoprotein-sorting protein